MNDKSINQLHQKKDEICNAWMNSKNIKITLKKHNIKIDFFQKHFAYKVINHVIDVLDRNKNIDQSPIMYILTQFFKTKSIDLSDIFVICSELAFIFQENFNDEVCSPLVEILNNKLRIVEDHMNMTRAAIENDQLFILNTKTNSDNLKYIRFTSPNDLNSDGLIDILDDNQISNISDLNQAIDILILLLDKVSILDEIKAHQHLPEIISTFTQLTNHLNTIALFPIISNSLENLIFFLSSIKGENLKNENKRSLLFIMLIGLSEDLSKWVDTVFIKKVADDIYYGDASFANNCLEIELLFDDSHKEKNINLDDQIMSQDDLMMSFLD
jgi:hypothetical protein